MVMNETNKKRIGKADTINLIDIFMALKSSGFKMEFIFWMAVWA